MNARVQRYLYTVGLLAVIALLFALVSQRFHHGKAPDWDNLCLSGQPYSVVASYRAQSRAGRAPDMDAPSILLFQDTPSDRVHYKLANFTQVGTVWGLAYRRSDRTIFAATYHKRAMPYGPAGAGGIYRIHLDTGAIERFAIVPSAGISGRRTGMSNDKRTFDAAAASLVGKAALGGIDTNEDESQLFVVNLADRRIYRYSLPDGQPMGNFAIGSKSEAWSANARPFALKFHGGKLYHGVVNDSGNGDEFVARVYRSDPDGTQLETVATVDLRYLRNGGNLTLVGGPAVKWGAWVEFKDSKPGDPPSKHVPQPMLTDIAFAEDGTMVLGLRDRFTDQVVPWIDEQFETATRTTVFCPNGTCPPSPPSPTPAVYAMAEDGLGMGDIVHAVPSGSVYDVMVDPEHFDDSNAVGHGEGAFGGLACLAGTNRVGATFFGVDEATSSKVLGEEGVYWYDVKSGSKVGHEVVGQPGSFRDYTDLLKQQFTAWADNESTTQEYEVKTRIQYNREIGSLGDIETLCVDCGILPTSTPLPPSDTPVPTDTPTSEPTPLPPTSTPTLTTTPTETPRPPTVTPTPFPKPVYLPVALPERCDPATARGDIILVIDTSSSMVGEKIVAARAAANAFVNALHLPDDQVGIVTFNATASFTSRLSGNAAALHAAINQISTAPGTRIDTGLDLAIQLLAGPERKASNTPVVIVMTDGLQTVEPERPQQLASHLRSSGVVVYAIGLGSDVDAAYLVRLAGDSSRIKLSPTAAELTAIYLEIAKLIPCAPSTFWGGR